MRRALFKACDTAFRVCTVNLPSIVEGSCVAGCKTFSTSHAKSLFWREVNRIQHLGLGRQDQAKLANKAGASRRFYNQSWSRRRWFVPQIPEDTALYGLLGANVAVFLLWRANPLFAARNFTTSLDGIKSGRLHTLVTCTFSQRDTWHLVSNMIGLYFFGRSCAYILGGGGLVILYLAGGVIGSLTFVVGQGLQSQAHSQDPYDRYYAAKLEGTPALGSSGAINSIVIFDILMAPKATVMIYGILPMHAWILGALFLYQDINGALGHGRTDIGYTVHLAGTAVGALAFWGVRRGKIPTQWRRW